MSYTKGPWAVGDASAHGQFIVDHAGERIVAETYPDYEQDFEANARLIATAPEMLKQLEEALSYISSLHQSAYGRGLPANNSVAFGIRNIIAKAKGK